MYESYSHQILTSCINDAVIITSHKSADGADLQIVFVNAAFTQLTGYLPEEVLGKSLAILQGPDTDPDTAQEIRAVLAQGRPIHTEILNYTKSGSPCWVDLKIFPLPSEAEVTHFAAIARDMTESRRMQQELLRLAHSDVLTGIADGKHFMLLAESEFYRNRRYRRPLAIVRFDLDNFAGFNRIHGQRSADDAIKTVAENCRNLLRQSDMFGRIGGEKFALLLPETDLEPAQELADRLCTLLSVIQVPTRAGETAVTASFGVTITADTDDNLFDAFDRAEGALADARKGGKNTVRTRVAGNVRYLKNG